MMMVGMMGMATEPRCQVLVDRCTPVVVMMTVVRSSIRRSEVRTERTPKHIVIQTEDRSQIPGGSSRCTAPSPAIPSSSSCSTTPPIAAACHTPHTPASCPSSACSCLPCACAAAAGHIPAKWRRCMTTEHQGRRTVVLRCIEGRGQESIGERGGVGCHGRRSSRTL